MKAVLGTLGGGKKGALQRRESLREPAFFAPRRPDAETLGMDDVKGQSHYYLTRRLEESSSVGAWERQEPRKPESERGGG